jgi:hypothetical protein
METVNIFTKNPEIVEGEVKKYKVRINRSKFPVSVPGSGFRVPGSGFKNSKS